MGFKRLAAGKGFEPATHSLEGLKNLRNTMLNNGLQRVGSRCSPKQGSSWRWVWSHFGFAVSAGGCRKTDKFERPLEGRLSP